MFVVRSIRSSARSRWLITQAAVSEKTMSAGPSPTGTRATTFPVAAETRMTLPPWSSATHTEPPPIQTLYGAEAPTLTRLVTRAVDGLIRYSVDAVSSAQTEP